MLWNVVEVFHFGPLPQSQASPFIIIGSFYDNNCSTEIKLRYASFWFYRQLDIF